MDPEYSELFERLNKQLDNVEDVLKPLKDAESIFELAEGKSELEQAKLYITMSYAINSTLYSFYKLNGIDASERPVMQELQRVKNYISKIQQAEKNVNPKTEAVNTSNAAISSSSSNRPKVAKDAATRIIKHHT
ncbi:putative exosome-associated family protein [Schizosaccharomyces pombe]|uniref:Exosome complex protein C1739.07 n=1 Tax=Schizosaccharomyces pombe (strain 972 / ATCC 24843) TaxID=284812 RepID=YQC7_SCHPO|nr:Cut3-interacting putative exosome subunit Cti1 [Schizosaccharomyces pombe]O74469.1 RecName: Full=Exosome complex protein C1739.07 [Schizosaccharomyces pombe 972h-]CAA20781.1 Cut3 interacting protein Cti1, predicted exosome subunit [Schizosaccharomyces pombe]|eukprot:NP_588415.1 Cut3-interacting putative exosome subunit Cti1 [Schizosaccharomyces pombe]